MRRSIARITAFNKIKTINNLEKYHKLRSRSQTESPTGLLVKAYWPLTKTDRNGTTLEKYGFNDENSYPYRKNQQRVSRHIRIISNRKQIGTIQSI